MKKKTTRLTALILSVLMLIGILSGCAGKKTPGEQSKEDGKISISFYACYQWAGIYGYRD